MSTSRRYRERRSRSLVIGTVGGVRRNLRALVVPAIRLWEARFARHAAPGSAAWLRWSEARFGGIATDVPRRRVSPQDPRSPAEVAQGGMIGGDRMSRLHHDYAPTYARHLARWLRGGRPPIVVEVGILRGTGLAIWCDLFPAATVIGLDIDPSHFEENLPRLHERGAFRHNRPVVIEFDAYAPAVERLADALGDHRIDIVIDDGPHTLEATATTATALRPLLADRFTYFIEDNPGSVEVARESLGPARFEVGSGGLVVLWS